MLLRKASHKLARFYPTADHLDDSAAQKNWRLKVGCTPDQPCGKRQCSVCEWAAKRLFLKRARVLNAAHPNMRICKVNIHRNIDLVHLSEKSIARFKRRALAMALATTSGRFDWVGMWSVEPAWTDPLNYKLGFDRSRATLVAEFYSLLYAQDWLLPPPDLQEAAGDEATYRFGGCTGIPSDTLRWSVLDRERHYAMRKKAREFYLGFRFELPKVMESFIHHSADVADEVKAE